jgi:hypothetical protein
MTDLWFGNTAKFVTIPAPELPFAVSEVGYADSMGFENGGEAATVSQGFSKRYDFAYDIHDSDLLGLVRKFRQGSYGTGLLRFADPFIFERNLFSAAWAEPGLIEGLSWPNIGENTPTYGAVSANSYNQPARKATWSITSAANTAPAAARASFIIPIPPTYTLHLGVSGAVTGAAVQHVIAYNIAAGTSASSDLTLLTDTSSTRLNASFAGSSYDYVQVFNDWRTSSAASTATVTSRLAQLWPTGVTPTLTGNHIPGEGHTGLQFASGSLDGSYRVLDDSRYSSLGFSLVEVGAWL